MAIAVLVHVHPDPAVKETARLPEEQIQAFLYDISEFGIGLLTNSSLPWGALVDLELPRTALPILPRPSVGTMHIAGRVVHSIPSGAQYRIGVSFTRMDELDRALIRQLNTPTPQARQQDERRRVARVTLLDSPSTL